MAEKVVVGFTEKVQTGRKAYQILKQRVGKHDRVWKFYFTLRFCRNACPGLAQNESDEWSTQPDLSPSRAGQSAGFDSEADIKQLPLGSRYYRSMGYALVTPATSDSTLSKQPSLCTYLHGEELLHNSTEMVNSICALNYSLAEESKWKVNMITECAMFFLQRTHSSAWINTSL